MDSLSPFPTLPDWEQGWQPHPDQRQQFQRLYEQILTGNHQLNLTRITTAPDFWEKHLWDSLQGIHPWLMEESPDDLDLQALQPSRVIDIGTGGGFPGLPVAIASPTWQVSLLDATRKKVAFLETVAQTLALPNVETICDRAESLGQQPNHRQQYDLALIRAVGPASVCAEYALPLLRLGGMAVLYRGQWSPEEEQGLQTAIPQLGGSHLQTVHRITPYSRGTRHYVYLKKQQNTPDCFPRRSGIPTKRPL